MIFLFSTYMYTFCIIILCIEVNSKYKYLHIKQLYISVPIYTFFNFEVCDLHDLRVFICISILMSLG